MLAGQVLVILDLMVVLKDNPDFTQNYVELVFFYLFTTQHEPDNPAGTYAVAVKRVQGEEGREEIVGHVPLT